MEIRELTPDYAVSPQIAPEDAAAIAEAGYASVICNRPDAEVPEGLRADAVRAAAEAAGLRFVHLPVTHGSITPELVAAQREAIGGGRALAYCASGTRSTIVWALGAAGAMPTDEIVSRAAAAGYDVSGLRDQLGAAGR